MTTQTTAPLARHAAAFMAQNPTILGIIGDRTYYEHPILGDAAPMFYIEDGRLRRSAFWDIESAHEAYSNHFEAE